MTAVEQLITDNLNIWSSAINAKSAAGRGTSKKIDLYGIKKLRELILELAVRGLLVPQNNNDEPALELLKKITLEKNKLVKEGKIKKLKNLQEIDNEEKFYNLPLGWEFVRLNDLGEWGAGATPRRGDLELYGGNIPWFKSGELVGDFISESEETVTELALKKASLRYNKIGDVLLAMYGATIGKTSILTVPATTNQAVCACTPFSGFSNVFLLTLLKAYRQRFIGMGAGGAQPNISREKIINTVIALPPTEEQHRIVAKVDELMVHCDQLEQQTEASISAHQTLVQTLLETLTNTSECDGFTQAWARIAEHFDALFTTEWSIDKLKQTILQLGVMGKIVPQNPSDEPASELLKKIALEKSKLLEEGIIKKQKLLPPIEEGEKTFELPVGWEWGRLQDISEYIQRGKGPKYSDFGVVRVISQKCIQWSGFNIDISRFVDDNSLDKYQDERFLRNNDLLWNSTGTGTVGRINLINDIDSKTLVADSHVTVIRTFLENAGFIYNYISSPGIQNRISPTSENPLVSGTTNQVELNTSVVVSLPVPIPPLEEQHRIVTKIDELMTLCDKLKSKIDISQITQLQLADSIGEQVFGHKSTVKNNTIEENKIMKISTQLTLGSVDLDDTALIASLVRAEDGVADAKVIWSKTKLELSAFYKQLKKEIAAGFIAKPAQAEFEG